MGKRSAIVLLFVGAVASVDGFIVYAPPLVGLAVAVTAAAAWTRWLECHPESPSDQLSRPRDTTGADPARR